MSRYGRCKWTSLSRNLERIAKSDCIAKKA
jgi:hypothetical protein